MLNRMIGNACPVVLHADFQVSLSNRDGDDDLPSPTSLGSQAQLLSPPGIASTLARPQATGGASLTRPTLNRLKESP